MKSDTINLPYQAPLLRKQQPSHEEKQEQNRVVCERLRCCLHFCFRFCLFVGAGVERHMVRTKNGLGIMLHILQYACAFNHCTPVSYDSWCLSHEMGSIFQPIKFKDEVYTSRNLQKEALQPFLPCIWRQHFLTDWKDQSESSFVLFRNIYQVRPKIAVK